ncbi:hypothetical protein D3C84_909820 [compost metagenome]
MPKQKPKTPLAQRILDAECHSNRWLADGNAAAEAGDKAEADSCYAKSQYWLDRFNHLSGRGDKAPPTE